MADSPGDGVFQKKQRRKQQCHEETAQDQEDKVREQAEAWDKVAVQAGAEVLPQARAATAFARSAGKKRPINRARPAISSYAPSVEQRCRENNSHFAAKHNMPNQRVNHWIIIPIMAIGGLLLLRWFEEKGF
jgi:uncharacterized membrane protein